MLTGVALAAKSRQRRPPFSFSSCLRARSPAAEVGTNPGFIQVDFPQIFPTFSSETAHLFVVSFERFVELLRLCFDAAGVSPLRETSTTSY